MEPQKNVKPPLNPRVILPCFAALIALVLIVLICIFASSASNMQNEYAQARDSIGADLFTNLSMFSRTYDDASLAGADVHGKILPTMQEYYLAAITLDDAIVNAFGQSYQILDANMRARIEAAFDAFDAAYAQGQSTTQADESMRACLQSVQQILSTRFDDDTRLLPA